MLCMKDNVNETSTTMAEKFFSKRIGVLRTTVKDNM